MTAANMLSYLYGEIKRNGTNSAWWYRRVFVPYVLGPVTRISSESHGYSEAVTVMEEDWDNLFILDACRADFFERVANLEQFEGQKRVVSQGSHSSEWTRRNFAGKQFGDTVYVTGNPHTKLLARNSFHDIIELRNEDQEITPLPSPETVANAAKSAHEKYPDKRLIVHFMQPHTPVHVRPENGFDELSSEEWWDMYEESLRYVLADAVELHSEIDGKTVISADHGETHSRRLLWIFEIQSHPPRIRIPELVEVPWAVLSGERRNVKQGEVRRLEPDEDVRERLQDIGYIA
jgi:hypothetical protein